MQATSDEALIGRIAAGDKLAMHLLFARHKCGLWLSPWRGLGFPGRVQETQ